MNSHDETCELSNALDLARAYATFNPHASIRLTDSAGTVEIKATNPHWKKWLPSNRVPPHWFTREQPRDLIAAHLAEEVGKQLTVRKFIEGFLGFRGTQKQKLVVDRVGLSGQCLHDFICGSDIDMGKVE